MFPLLLCRMACATGVAWPFLHDKNAEQIKQKKTQIKPGSDDGFFSLLLGSHIGLTMYFSTFFMWSFLSLLFLVHDATANDLTLMNPRAQEDPLALSANLPPDDLPVEISGKQPTSSDWTLDSGSEPESQQTNDESPESPLLDSNDSGNCNNGPEHSSQTLLPSRSRRSLTPFKKRGDPNSCSLQQPKQPVPLQGSPGEVIPGNSKAGPLMGPEPNPQSLRMLLYSVPGIDGPSNRRLCKIPSEPMHQVPVCAPKYQEISPAAVLVPCRFCKSEVLKCYISPFPSFHPMPSPIEKQETPLFAASPKSSYGDTSEKENRK